MSKPEPNWAIWRHMPRLSAHEAVALSLGVDPDKVSEQSLNKWSFAFGKGMTVSIPEFGPRLNLFRRCHERLVSFEQLATWAQSVGWNVPKELAEASPVPAKPDLPTVPGDVVRLALQSAVSRGKDTDELRSEIEQLGCRFVMIGEQPMLHIPDGTVKGRYEPLSRCYHALSDILATNPKAERLGHVLRGSGASGGGAIGGSVASGIPVLPQIGIQNPNDEGGKSDPKNKLPDAKSSMSSMSCSEDTAALRPLTTSAIAQLFGSFMGVENPAKVMSEYPKWATKNGACIHRGERGLTGDSDVSAWNPVRFALNLLDKAPAVPSLGRKLTVRDLDSVFEFRELAGWKGDWNSKRPILSTSKR